MRGTTLAHIFFLIPLLAIGAANKKIGPENPKASAPVAIPATSHFEGRIDLALSLETGKGDLELNISGDMAKLEMQIVVNPLPDPIRFSVLFDAKFPKTAYLLSDITKSYSSINLADAVNLPEIEKGKGKYKVKILGEEKILGFVCTHITLMRDKDLIDAWVTQDMPDVYRILKMLQEANPQMGTAELFQALEETGHAGLPMRCIVIRDGQRVTTEVKKVERKLLSASLFIIPKDYARMESSHGK
jgi:hypothetical protein